MEALRSVRVRDGGRVEPEAWVFVRLVAAEEVCLWRELGLVAKGGACWLRSEVFLVGGVWVRLFRWSKTFILDWKYKDGKSEQASVQYRLILPHRFDSFLQALVT